MDSENTGIPATMLVGPTGYGGGYGNNGGFGFGGDWAWILLLLLIGGNGWGMGGFGGAMPFMMGMDGGFGLYPWLNNSQHISDGFRDQNLATAINGVQNSVTSGFGDVQNALCGGFAGVNATVNSGVSAITSQLYANTIADLERSFASQTASTQGMNSIQSQLAQCCCDNRAATADLKYTVATEACADRAAISDALKDVIAANTASTQRILDQLCADKLEAKNTEIQNLRQQLNMADLRASQTAQNAFISQGFANEVDALYNRLNSCPVPTTPVYGRTPIFTCNQQAGCGCNGGFVN